MLPVYQRKFAELAAVEGFPPRRFGRGLRRDPNVAFDLHLYHCFGEDAWQRRPLHEILERAESGAGHFPGLSAVAGDALVSEFSLRLPEWSEAFPAKAALEALSQQ